MGGWGVGGGAMARHPSRTRGEEGSKIKSPIKKTSQECLRAHAAGPRRRQRRSGRPQPPPPQPLQKQSRNGRHLNAHHQCVKVCVQGEEAMRLPPSRFPPLSPLPPAPTSITPESPRSQIYKEPPTRAHPSHATNRMAMRTRAVWRRSHVTSGRGRVAVWVCGCGGQNKKEERRCMCVCVCVWGGYNWEHCSCCCRSARLSS